MKNVNILMAFSLFFFCSFQSIAQRTCGTLSLLEIQQKNPEHAIELQRIEAQTSEFIENIDRSRRSQIVTIPTVFHIIHTGVVGPSNNISDDYIYAQLSQINDDFRRMNSNADDTWPQADDTEIEFCLATFDPDGNPTTGINRYEYDTGTWTQSAIDATIKPQTIWNRDAYLNIWLIPYPIRDSGYGILGYAQYPGEEANTDGIVIKTSSAGSLAFPNPEGALFNLGRTATHEIGHWLNLIHIWGENQGCEYDDFVDDTPDAFGPDLACFEGSFSCGSTDMVQNYMDYSVDPCMKLFTTGQKNRMRALFAAGGYRESILTSQGCMCPNDMNITDTYNNGDNGYFEAGNWITSTATVNAGADITHDAGNYICLNPGFIADNGSVFLGKIDGCDNDPENLIRDESSQNQFLQDESEKLKTTSTEQITLKNYPNPFTGITTIEFTLKEDSPVTLSVSDITGKQIAVLLNSKWHSASTHQVTFDGNTYPAGMYYYTIQAGEYIGTQKMTLVK